MVVVRVCCCSKWVDVVNGLLFLQVVGCCSKWVVVSRFGVPEMVAQGGGRGCWCRSDGDGDGSAGVAVEMEVEGLLRAEDDSFKLYSY